MKSNFFVLSAMVPNIAAPIQPEPIATVDVIPENVYKVWEKSQNFKKEHC